MKSYLHPVLTCKESANFEKHLLGDDEEKSWAAMSRAGKAVAERTMEEWQILGGKPKSLLLVIGKGHNGGDACLAVEHIHELHPEIEVDIVLAQMEQLMRPLARRSLVVLKSALGDNGNLYEDFSEIQNKPYDIAIEGLIGMRFVPPIKERERSLIDWLSGHKDIRMKVSVDMPSGLGDKNDEKPFRADLTIATGIAKLPLFQEAATFFTGRRRYADIGFFDEGKVEGVNTHILNDRIFHTINRLRPSASDKRSFGHVLVVGGSRGMLGAVFMTVLSALRSGAGLVTAFVPALGMTPMAADLPEAMWMPCGLNDEGGLDSALPKLIEEKLAKASALVIGPGIGESLETRKTIRRLIGMAECPIILDADALHETIVTGARKIVKGDRPIVLTPHVGEYNRIAENSSNFVTNKQLVSYTKRADMTVVLKGPVSRICYRDSLIYSTYGSPALARGGSGDCLAGILGARLARSRGDGLEETCQAVAWHGRAAELLAQDHGEETIRTTQILDYLPKALRHDY